MAAERLSRIREIGGGVLLAAALAWGVGNAFTGMTARRYAEGHSALPAMDIALANTLGGILLLLLYRAVTSFKGRGNSAPRELAGGDGARRRRLLEAGSLKGANTCLFVLAASFVAATQSLVLESTYVVWTLVLTSTQRRAFPSPARLVDVLALVIATVLTVQVAEGLPHSDVARGIPIGLFAGLTYAFFLTTWSPAAKQLTTLPSQVEGTVHMLAVALSAILVGSECVALLQTGALWVPGTHIRLLDLLLQTANGALVVGVTYILLTIAMQRLARATTNSALYAAMGLSFAIPTTLFTELLLTSFELTLSQVIGLALFLVIFVRLARVDLGERGEAEGSEMGASQLLGTNRGGQR